MKKSLLVSLLLSSTIALAAPEAMNVTCKSDARVSGRYATVDGTLLLSKHPIYPSPAKLVGGRLQISIKNQRVPTPVLQGEFGVEGQYDNVGNSEYANLAILGTDSVIYIDFNRDDNISNIEVDGERYTLICSKK